MYNEFHNPDLQAGIDKLAREWSALSHRASNAEEALRREVENHSRSVNRTLEVVSKNITLRQQIAAMEQEHKLHLERIERDTARITQLRAEKDHYASTAQELATENDRLKQINSADPGLVWKMRAMAMRNKVFRAVDRIVELKRDLEQVRTERDNYKKQIPNPDFVDSRIAEFQRVVKMLRERGDRWKERCMKRREELTLWASRAFKARKERDEARAEIAAIKADLTRALDSRTVKPFKSHPGC